MKTRRSRRTVRRRLGNHVDDILLATPILLKIDHFKLVQIQ
jgi:hypothetical protein